MRVRLDLAHDGTDFSGWARQPGLRTVQGTLEDALAVLERAPVALTVAGRTDAGVHATGQVAHADLTAAPDLRHLAGVLAAPDLVVRSATEVPPAFDARFSALARHYAYRVTDAPPDPLRRHDTLGWPRPLDAGAMDDAAHLLVGERDFASFCKRREGATTVREVLSMSVARDGEVVVVSVSADAFCHSMVRSLTGALLAVGEGRRAVGWPAEQLARRSRDGGAAVAPAHGLTLVGVDYPDGAAALAAREAATRRVRA